MNAFEVFEGDTKDQSVCCAFRSDFAKKIALMLTESNGRNPAVWAFCRQLESACNVVEGNAKPEDYPDLKEFSLVEDDGAEMEKRLPEGMT